MFSVVLLSIGKSLSAHLSQWYVSYNDKDTTSMSALLCICLRRPLF